ncbi:hypothetical protein Misp01_44860 [Microtetraspora sp. NBRC 13810]|nr:hypothetical protein Misp01_44860 [Microtetraspora sp. NBRC 13810]
MGRMAPVRALQTPARQGWTERERGCGSCVKGWASRVRPGVATAEQSAGADGVVDVRRVPARNAGPLTATVWRAPAIGVVEAPLVWS